MAERRPLGDAREANPLLVALAEVAVAVVERRRETGARRRRIVIVDRRGGAGDEVPG